MTSKQELEALLLPHEQHHLLAFWEELSEIEQQTLAAEIGELDPALMSRLFQQQGAAVDWAALAGRAEPPPAVRLDGRGNRFTGSEARQRGEQALRAAQVAVILVAGGQGSRLGFDAPKGVFPIGPVSGASLFQILLEKLLAVGRRYGARIPLYVMTSQVTHEPTAVYLSGHDRFGLSAEDVSLFCQGTMPAVDCQTGRLLLAGRGSLFRSPDGHGGMLGALGRHGLLADCRRRGIQHVFYLQIDNPLATMCDPEFLGQHLLSGSEMSTQVIAKQTPLDRVGNFVLVDGQTLIIEYSDLPRAIAERRNPDGSLKLWAGSIGVHVFEVAFLERMAGNDAALPFHLARKKVACIDASGQRLEPARENAIKFERFIFDLLPHARDAIAVEVDEQRTFAPVKNASGEKKDTPESVKAQMIALHSEWLRAAGAELDPGIAVEISPLFALDAQELAGKIKPGLHVTKPTYFGGG